VLCGIAGTIGHTASSFGMAFDFGDGTWSPIYPVRIPA
jgi:hypothetical protein